MKLEQIVSDSVIWKCKDLISDLFIKNEVNMLS